MVSGNFIAGCRAQFAHLDKRGTVKLSTKIKVARDRRGNKAGRVAARLNATLEAYWRGLSERVPPTPCTPMPTR